MKCSAFIAASLDGYIARPNGDLDWLPGASSDIPDEDHGYDAFMKDMDVLVMGRGTYEKVLTFDEWPYPIPVIVLSKTLPEIADDRASVVRSLAEAVDAANAMDAKGVYVDGGQTIQTFLRADLIDEITVTRAPVLIGSGFPLFGELDQDVRLRLEHVESQDGYLMARYQVVR